MTYDIASIKTSSTTPGQRSPDRGGFFQRLYHGFLALDTDLYLAQRLGIGHWRRLDNIQTKEELKSVSNRINLEKRVLQ